MGLLRFELDTIRVIVSVKLKPQKPHLKFHCLIDYMSLRTSKRYHVLKTRREVDENSSVSEGTPVTHVGLDPLIIAIIVITIR